MRLNFSDIARLQKVAENNLKDGIAKLKRWWCKKYNRPPNDPLFTEQTLAELQLEMFEDLLVNREELLEQLESAGDVIERSRIRDQLDNINKVFGYKPDFGEDDLIDQWEQELLEGKTPDLSRKA